jgi:SpoVK/Ycf46/Vps4 family AAA+-type ATPase
MKKYAIKESRFSEIEFVGGQDAKGREESWKVMINEIEWVETNRDYCYAPEGSKSLEAEFTLKVQKQKDGKPFGATQKTKYAYTEKDIEKFIQEAKQKAKKSAAQ